MTYKQNLSLSLSLLIGLFVAAWPGAQAQVLNPLPCQDQQTLPEGCALDVYEVQSGMAMIPFQLQVPSGGAITSCTISTGTFPPGLTLNSNGTITGTPTSGAGGITYNFTVSATSGMVAHTGNFSLSIRTSGDARCAGAYKLQPCQREIVFILDKSGSMNLPAETGIAGSRWQKLRDVMDAELTTLSSLGLAATDTVEIILFGGGVVRQSLQDLLPIPIIDDLIPPATIPSGGTPLGGGIQMAIQRSLANLGRPGHGKRRMLFIVSDGVQNMNPMVDDSDWSLRCTAPHPPGGVAPTDVVEPALPAIPPLGAGSIPLTTGLNETVEIRTVGIGNLTGAAHTAMDGLPGDYQSTSGVANLILITDALMTGWLAVSTPRIVDARNGQTASQGTIEKFVVNDSVQNITVRFFATDQSFLNTGVQIFKDGKRINGGKMTIRPKFQLWHIDLTDPKVKAENPGLVIAGDWEAHLPGDDRNLPYAFTAIVEDDLIHHTLSIGNGEKLYAGDPLPVKATLTYRGVGVPKAKKAVAILYRPGDDLGEVASAAPTPAQLTSSEQGGSLGQAKVDHVTSQTQYYEKLREQNRLIDLSDNGNGEYTGTFIGNEVTGGYRVVVRLEGAHPNAKSYQDWQMEGAFFDFSRPEDVVLKKEVVPVGKPVKGEPSTYIVRITPVNKFGNRIGPGQESRIRVTSAQGNVGVLKDNLDGSYEVPIVTPHGSDPVITVHIADTRKPVYRGPLIEGIKPWSLSLHAGLTLPTAKLDSLHNPGIFAEADLNYRINNRWDAEMLLGYYGFSGGDFNILGASALAGYRFDLEPSIYLRPAVGIGYFKPKGQTATAGYTARLELAKSFNSRLDGTLHGAYFSLPDPDYTFWAAGLGLKYRL